MNIDDIFSIASDADFRRVAMRVFRFQAAACGPYAEYLGLLGVDPAEISTVEQIPFLPIEFFKSRRVYCGSEPCEIEFTSSGTTGGNTSRHYVHDLSVYERSFVAGFERFYGPVADWEVYALLPGYLEREGSSLIYMVDKLIGVSGGGGFFLRDHDELLDRLRGSKARRRLLIGVSYALWDLAERSDARLPDGTIVMETGGMKGRRREIPREELHAIMQAGLGVSAVHSEYGMTELLSQAYSAGEGLFSTPPWMKIAIRDARNPLNVRFDGGATGGINVIDLANIYSCSFIATSDLGRIVAGDDFCILGRMDGSDIRGCNLLLE